MKTNLWMQVRSGLSVLFLCLLTPLLLHAGSGSITPAPANDAGIKGLMNFSVNFRYVPTAADITAMQAALQVANNVICDATDGQIVFGTVTITAGSVNEAQADIWVLPDPGRSGVSFWTDGSSLGRNGDHITLFSDGIDGRVIAHELGHLAFGLGDAYDEQCRWGGPCGIGPSIDPTNVDARNNTLMANHLTMNELTVAANHDPLQGDGSGCPTEETCTDAGVCTGDACDGYNSETGRYETSQHTFIHGGKSDWEILQQNYSSLGLTLPTLPVAAQPASCGAFMNIVTQVEGSSLVVLAFDRSGSMDHRDGGDRTRLDFAQAAGRAFVDLQQNKDIDLGIVEFSSTASTVRPVGDLTPTNAEPYKDDIDALFPDGYTAIGDGLIEARVQLQIAQAIAAAAGETLTNPTVFLLSDGQNNRGADPDAVADNLIAAGITIHSIPVGNGADVDLLAELAAESGGQMLPANTDDMIPAIYAELAAHQQGHSLINSRVRFEEHIFFEFPVPSMVIDLPVERGAEVLTIFLGLKDVDDVNLESNNIGRGVDLIDPNGNKVPKDQFTIIEDAYYRILHIQNPQTGNYTLYVRNSQLVAADLNIVSFVENPLPDFYIDALPSVLSTPEPVRISGTATFAVNLFDPNIRYRGFVIRPDNSQVPISMRFNPMTGAVSADFTAFNGGGTYRAVVEAIVPGKARIVPGESIFTATSEYSIEVDPFVRVASTSFTLFTPGLCPPCGANPKDCDGDGIPNDREDAYPQQDVDGDGLPNRCDEDSDGDDIPDAEEKNLDLNKNNIPDVYEVPRDLACRNIKFQIVDVKIQEPTCKKADGKIDIKVKGAEGNVKYSWSHDPKLTKAKATDLPAFIYSVTAIDKTGCRRTVTINLTEDCAVFDDPKDVPVTVSCPGQVPQGCEFPVVVTVDMSSVAAPDHQLGSFTGTLNWDPARVAFVGPAETLSGFSGMTNLDAAAGQLIFNGANAAGVDGVVDIFKAQFRAIGPIGATEAVEVSFTSFASAKTFVDLTPELAIESCIFRITASGMLGDVNGDGRVTSTDANIILSYDVGLELPPAMEERIKAGLGDVNQDGKTDATDALIILTYDAQLPVPYPVGEAFCLDGQLTDFTDRGIAPRSMPTIDIYLRPQPLADHPDQIDVAVTADITRIAERLGSYKAVVSWDPEALQLRSDLSSLSADFGSPTVNDQDVDQGMLVIAHADANGITGKIDLMQLPFTKLQADGLSSLNIRFVSMTATETFTPIQAQVRAESKPTALSTEVKVFPNPFTQQVNLAYEVPEAAEVEVAVYNLVGQEIAVLAKGPQASGLHRLTWQVPVTQGIPSGLLLFRVRIGDTVTTKRVMYMRE